MQSRLKLFTCALLPVLAALALPRSAAAANNCSERSQRIWTLAAGVASFVPQVGGAVAAGISLAGSIAAGRCEQNQRPVLTMDQLRAEIVATSGQVVDEALRQQLVTAADTLLRLLEPYRNTLERLDELDAAQREALAEDLENLAVHAIFLESDTRELNWPIIPVYVQFASLKLGLYQLAYELRAPGPDRDSVGETLAIERQASMEILAAHERNYVAKSPRLTRTYNVDGLTFEIRTKVTNGAVTVLEDQWRCSKTVFQPRKCRDRGSRRNEMFTAARDRFRILRTRQMQALDVNYLAFKNALFDAQGPAFLLQSGAGEHTFSAPASPGKVCLSASAQGTFSARECGADVDAADADLRWGLVPGTGQLYNLGQRACLQADDAGVLTTAPCAEVAPPELDVDGDVVGATPSPQSWGHHPSGYFMHLATGRCLNLAQDVPMPANAQMKTTPGVGVVLAPCDLASVGYLEAGSYYRGGFGLSHANVLDSDLGEDVWRVVPTTSTGWQVE